MAHDRLCTRYGEPDRATIRAFDDENREETCMQFTSIVVAAGIGLGCCALADAGAKVGARSGTGSGQAGADRFAGDWVEAHSLRELPAGIQALLGVGLGEDGGIADRGASFNASDVAGGGLPRHRFVLGAVNGDIAVVAVEQGGRGYRVETMEFRQVGATWEPVRCAVGAEAPQRSAELLGSIASPRAASPGTCRLPGSHHINTPTTPAATTDSGPPANPQPRLRLQPGA
jgi:hypothetical protein